MISLLQVPSNFRFVVEQTLREFFKAIQEGRDAEQSWKKSIYKIISRLDDPVPEYFKSPNFLEQLEWPPGPPGQKPPQMGGMWYWRHQSTNKKIISNRWHITAILLGCQRTFILIVNNIVKLTGQFSSSYYNSNRTPRSIRRTVHQSIQGYLRLY